MEIKAKWLTNPYNFSVVPSDSSFHVEGSLFSIKSRQYKLWPVEFGTKTVSNKSLHKALLV